MEVAGLLFGLMPLLLWCRVSCEPGQPSSVNEPVAALYFMLQSAKQFLSHHPSSSSSVSCASPRSRQWGLKCRDLLLRLVGLRDSPGFYLGGPGGGRLRRRLMTKARDGKAGCLSARLASWQRLIAVPLLEVKWGRLNRCLSGDSLVLQVVGFALFWQWLQCNSKGNVKTWTHLSLLYHPSLMFSRSHFVIKCWKPAESRTPLTTTRLVVAELLYRFLRPLWVAILTSLPLLHRVSPCKITVECWCRMVGPHTAANNTTGLAPHAARRTARSCSQLLKLFRLNISFISSSYWNASILAPSSAPSLW